MSRVVELLCSRRTPQVAVLALMSVGFAGCSADTQTRFSQNSFSNPFSSQQAEATGSVASPTPQVEQRELPQYARPQPQYQSSAPPPAVAAAPAAAQPKPVAAAAPVAAPPSVHVVNRGDTLLSIAHRNHVPVADLAKANGMDAKAKLKLGQKITVPGAKSAAVAAPAQPAVAAAQPAAVAAPATKVAVAEPAKEKARLAQATTTPEAAVTETPVKTAEATGALPTFRWPVRGRVVTAYGAKT